MDVTVALCGSGRRSVAEHGIHTRWRHHRSLGMAFVHSRVDPAPVIRAIAGQRGHRPGDLIEQGADLGGVIDAALGQHGSDDPARVGLHTEAQGMPGVELPAQKAEARVACAVINRMTGLGMPVSRKIA